MHTTAHALRRAAQLLRLLADHLDPPAIPTTTVYTDGWTQFNNGTTTNNGWTVTQP